MSRPADAATAIDPIFSAPRLLFARPSGGGQRSRASVARGNMVDTAIATRFSAPAPDTQSFASVRPIITIGAAQITARAAAGFRPSRGAERWSRFGIRRLGERP